MSLAVEAIKLCKHYRFGTSDVSAVSNVSLNVEEGEFLAVQGRSGSGKTTLMNLLGLLDRPDSGQYFLAGNDVAALGGRGRTNMRNCKIGFVFQLPTLMPRCTAWENVELPLVYAGLTRRDRERSARAALDRVGLSHRHHRWPNQLSGGEQQRVAVARALVNNPTLLLADEPTGALDSKTSDEILNLLEALNRDGCTIILVTHAADIAKRASRCITLHDGLIVHEAERQDVNGLS